MKLKISLCQFSELTGLFKTYATMNILNKIKGKFIRRITLINIVLALLIVLLPSFKSKPEGKPEDKLWKKAIKICENNLILDAHIDWPDRILEFREDISEKTRKGDFDLVRAKEGGLNASLSVVYINSDYEVSEGRYMVDSILKLITDYPKIYPEKFAMALNPKDVKQNFKSNLFSLPLCLENGSPVGNDIAYLRYLKKQGIVYITLTHNKANQISDSNFDENRKWNGLSPFGLEVIKEMNRLGIMIDISHSTDSTVFQSLRYSMAPVIASHSSCRFFTPGLERNLPDALIKAIAKKNGIIMVNFCSMFLDSICMKNCSYLLNWYHSHGIKMDSDEGIDFARKYEETHKIKSNSIQVVDHIEHIIKVAGIDFVGIGSDYDGMGPAQPTDLPDVSCYPLIVYELLKRGYTKKDIKKILAGNFLRVWDEVIKVAAEPENL
jgi:membrane dipeptidase